MSDNIAMTASSSTEQSTTATDLSNLRAIREILSYIHVDAVQDGYREVAERIDFAMSAAESALKRGLAAVPAETEPAKPVNPGADEVSQTSPPIG